MRDEHVDYLDPPHYHRPGDLLQCIAPRPTYVELFPAPIKDAIRAILMSTSILFASLNRLRLLYEDVSESLHSNPPEVQDSSIILNMANPKTPQLDPETFNRRMRFWAEKYYFDEEVEPDWRGKARIVDLQLDNLDGHLPINELRLEGIIMTWWGALKRTVSFWLEESKALRVPEL